MKNFINYLFIFILLNISLLNYQMYSMSKTQREDHETLYALIHCDTTIIKAQVNLDVVFAEKMRDLYYSDSVKNSQIKQLHKQYRYLRYTYNKK